MSDRAPVQVIVYACPEEKRDELFKLLALADLGADYGGPDPEGTLEIGETYGDDDARLDAYADISADIIEQVPEATFVAWGDPKYEFDGSTVMYAPDLGRYEGLCNANGEPYLTARQIRDAMTDGDVWKAAGLPWLKRFDELSAP